MSKFMKIVKGGSSMGRGDVSDVVDKYVDLHKEEVTAEERLADNSWLVKKYYDLATDFYEYGWGECFHFAPRFKAEEFKQSLARHEHYLALMLNLRAGMKCLDLGCGVGGPAREIARFSGASVTGMNINEYQLQRFAHLTKAAGLEKLVNCEKASFDKIPRPDNSMDGVYQIEAFCHAKDIAEVYREVYRVLKPGACFAGYEWIMTDKYDPTNPEHVAVKRGIEEGNGISDMRTADVVNKAMADAGFEIIETRDKSDGEELDWYNTLAANFSIKNFQYTAWGRWTTGFLVGALETIRLAPKGTTKINSMLMRTAEALVKGGKLGIFTATYLMVGRKPAEGQAAPKPTKAGKAGKA